MRCLLIFPGLPALLTAHQSSHKSTWEGSVWPNAIASVHHASVSKPRNGSFLYPNAKISGIINPKSVPFCNRNHIWARKKHWRSNILTKLLFIPNGMCIKTWRRKPGALTFFPSFELSIILRGIACDASLYFVLSY